MPSLIPMSFFPRSCQKKSDTATVKVIKTVMDGKIVPLLHDDILAEYEDVLYRDKFHLNPATIQVVLQAFKIYGMKVKPKKSDEIFSDPYDLIFYEVTLAKRDNVAYLVTGNQRHYPVTSANDFYPRFYRHEQ